MSLFEILLPLTVCIHLVCFDWSETHAKGVAILTSFMWLICVIAAGARA